jgi:hypothetical protein
MIHVLVTLMILQGGGPEASAGAVAAALEAAAGTPALTVAGQVLSAVSRQHPDLVLRQLQDAGRQKARARLRRVGPLDQLVAKYARKHGVDENLVRAVLKEESGGDPLAISPKGAMGLMQLMPDTAQALGVKDPFNPEENLDGGVRYLKSCLERFHHNPLLAVAAYNAGPGAVEKYGGCPPYQETEVFVARVAATYHSAAPLPGLRRKAQSSPAPAAPAQTANELAWRLPGPRWKIDTPRVKVPAPVWKGQAAALLSRPGLPPGTGAGPSGRGKSGELMFQARRSD